MGSICCARQSRISNAQPWFRSDTRSFIGGEEENFNPQYIKFYLKKFDWENLIGPQCPERAGTSSQNKPTHTYRRSHAVGTCFLGRAHFQPSAVQTALPTGQVGRCGLKTNAKIGSTFSPQRGNFQTEKTETDTVAVSWASTLGWLNCIIRV